MGWTDKQCTKTIHDLKNEFNVQYYVETGTYRGQGTHYWAHHFDYVLTCDASPQFYMEAYNKRLHKLNNVLQCLTPSANFLPIVKSMLNDAPAIYYLDAHFYDPTLPMEKRFVVQDELKALRNTKNCIIIIHDYDNGALGHITYDGIPMGWNIIGDLIQEVNPDFKYYTNTKEFCDIITMNDINERKIDGMDYHEDYEDTVNFVWSNEQKTYRGLLYAVPKELDLTKYKLIEYKP